MWDPLIQKDRMDALKIVQVATTGEEIPVHDSGKKLLEAARIGNEEEVRNLMARGASFTTDWLGNSPLHFAAQNGHLGTALVLMRAGMSWDAKTKVDKTPLHLATQNGHIELVKAFIQHGANVNARDMLKMTPLHWACCENEEEIVKLLLKNNADIHLRSKFDKTAYDVSIDNGNFKIAEMLNKGKKQEPPEPQEPPSPERPTVSSPPAQQPLEMLYKTPDLNSASMLASLTALAQAGRTMNFDTLSWLHSQSLATSPNFLENVRAVTLTDAGKLAMEMLNEKLLQSGSTPLRVSTDSTEEAVSEMVPKQKLRRIEATDDHICSAGTSHDFTRNHSFSQSFDVRDSDRASSAVSSCGRDVSDLLVNSSAHVTSIPFSQIFSDCNSTKNGESDDGCLLDLERDILEKQFENAKFAASRFREEVRKRENEAEKCRIQLQLLSKKRTVDTNCKNLS